MTTKKLPFLFISRRTLQDKDQEIDSLRARYEVQRAKLQKLRLLYEKRREATVNDFTDDEEMFLADISIVLEGEDVKYGFSVVDS